MKLYILLLFIAILAMTESYPGETGPVCVCGRIYRPVCASDGHANRTYDNECLLECEQRSSKRLKMLHEGVCHSDMDEI